MSLELAELLRFKDLLVELARRDVKLRYRQTALGVAWVVLQPIMAAGVLTFVFSVVAGMRTEGTSAFLLTYAGLIAWNVFAWTLTKTSLSMVGNAYLVSKVYFPRLILPLSGTLSTLLDVGISLGVFAVLLVFSGIAPTPGLVLLPVWILLLTCLALGIGLIAAALTVQYRDIQHVLPVLIPFALYASPVAYDIAEIPARFQQLMYLANPAAALIVALRWSVLGTPPPPAMYLAVSAATALVAFACGAAVFRRTERSFADVI